MSAKIAQAIHQVMSEVGYVQKTKKSPIGYKYAGEAGVLEALRPAMVKAGLLLLPSIAKVSDVDQHGNTHVVVEYTLAHKDGDIWPEKLSMAGTGNDRNKAGVSDKGIYKAITGANKYLLFKLFQIETGEDPENAAEYVPPEPDNITTGAEKTSAEAVEFISKIDLCANEKALVNYGETTKDDIAKLNEREQALVRLRYKARLKEFRGEIAA